ncbi:ssDNA-binding Zn-finger/Zn-ribbon topoisomerase 1 [Catalinimonas alkaloidigena]|uniref:FHA domain-containing protein n=1 Tax=Catalinimonas alkaloidigena TaxID=1075417 RepID=UPI002407014B|nr:FHA domain-containing protein [Catalinimonas alkaloidigena]MDF9798777.1 ssDNA-binding Zn-finger/Zn-ribbon topoisomerase 1 [Catalinimonas alkaloidigena]
MRNPFKKKSSKTKKEVPKPPIDPIKEPWNRLPNERPLKQTNKTIVGKKPEKPFLDQKAQDDTFDSGYQCPECSYPLRNQVSVATPCPNCGFVGVKTEQETTAKRTMTFSSLNFGKISNKRKFSLINEAAPDMSVSAELGEVEEISLGRDELDPDNPSISGNGHIQLRESQGKWFIKDISSNGATFVQALNYHPLYEGSRLILGNRIFLFSSNVTKNKPVQVEPNKTMQFGQFNISESQQGTFTLVDELNGTAKQFTGPEVTLNRFNLDPDDQSISSKQHASVEKKQDMWMIIDRSSNKATFVQCKNEVHIPHQTKLILGNKVFKFEIE